MLTTVTNIVLFMLSAATLVTFVRLLRGPTLPDRVVAMDLIGILSLGLMVVGAAASAERTFLDAAIVIALLGFVSNIAYARYIERARR
jgi:multicomponent Na+:H+ antiporter subunit F